MKAFVKKVSQKISKLSDDQIEKLFDQIAQENESLNSVLESLSTGLIICDENWNLMQLNKASERFIPFKTRYYEARQQDLQIEEPIWDLIDDEEISQFLYSASSDKKINISDEFILKTPAGAARYVSINLMPLVEQKKLTGTIIKIDDITEKRNQETLLHRMENLASLTNLAASVAHEIKNPLGSISIYIQLIQKAVNKARNLDNILPEEKFLENYLGIVNQEIDRLNKIIVDFLFAVRPISAELFPTDVSQLLKKFSEFYSPEILQKNIKLETSFAENSPKILIDEKLLKQVITNLIQNAIAAMPNGGKISITSFIKNDKYVITLTDNGCGMDQETVHRIFEPYFTTKATGTGLGLTMSYKIVKEFGGDIDVESEVDVGTTFTISLPIPQKEKRLLESK